jgi:Mpv17 / PMP22 family
MVVSPPKDEFVFSPMYIPVFLGSLWRLEGTPWPTIKDMLVRELPSIVVAEWTLWVPTMLLTFRYAPVKFHVLVINVVGVVWQTFLSFMAARAHGSADNQHDDKVNEEIVLYLETVVGHEMIQNSGGENNDARRITESKATTPGGATK